MHELIKKTEFSQRLVLFVTVAYFFVELFGGLYYHSIALVTDASFMAANISGQIIALWVSRFARRLPDKMNTFGYERAKVLSGLFNGILVGFILFYVLIEAVQKILNPQPIDADKVLVIAALGLVANAFGLVMLAKHAKDVNIKGALLLILNDTLGSVGVIVSAVIMRYTHLWFVDPLAGILIGCLAAYPTYHLIKASVHILMEGNPVNIDIDAVERFLHQSFPDIRNVKDMHIWSLSPQKIILLARVRTNGMENHRAMMKTIKTSLREKFGFSDVYVEGYEGLMSEPSEASPPEIVSNPLTGDPHDGRQPLLRYTGRGGIEYER
jgi:cobalt-zinc-cadmium efflux system protein